MRRHDLSANWPMSSVSMAQTIAALIAYLFRTAGSCKSSNSVAPPPWEATWSSATCVALNTPLMTRAETVPPQADQSLAKARWLEKQNAKLLPVGAFHLVFTLSHELNPLILANK